MASPRVRWKRATGQQTLGIFHEQQSSERRADTCDVVHLTAALPNVFAGWSLRKPSLLRRDGLSLRSNLQRTPHQSASWI